MEATSKTKSKVVKTVKTFKYAGQVGKIDMHNYVTWGGMGFHIDAACPGLKLAALDAK